MDELLSEGKEHAVENDENFKIIRGTRKSLKRNEKRGIRNKHVTEDESSEMPVAQHPHPGGSFPKTKKYPGRKSKGERSRKSELESGKVPESDIEETHPFTEVLDTENQDQDKILGNKKKLGRLGYRISKLLRASKLFDHRNPKLIKSIVPSHVYRFHSKPVNIKSESSDTDANNVLNIKKLSIEPEFVPPNRKRAMKSRVYSFKPKFQLKTLLRRRNAITGADGFGIPDKGERKRLLEKFENPENTSDSDSEEKEWDSPELFEDELDAEWLGVDKEYRLESPKIRVQIPQAQFLNTMSNADPNKEFMESMKYFWWTLMIGGRMPFQTYIEDHVTKFRLNKYSFSFVYFTISSVFLTFCTTAMVYSLIRISLSQHGNSLNIYEHVERLEVDKYWYYILVTLVASILASSCSLATIFDDGYILADFLTRWNLAINVMKYRPSVHIRKYFWMNVLVFVVYAIMIVFLFNTEEVPVVKGASGLIGLTICRPFSHQIRYSRNYPLIEKLGLFVHLYVTYSFRTFLLIVTLYCKALVNMTRKWNHRLAYVLGMLGRAFSHKNIISVISYNKLFVEHTIIIGFLRHIGRVFGVTLGIFYTLKMIELLILIYRVMSVIVYPLLSFNATHVEGLPDDVQPITYTDPPHVLIGASVFILLHSAAEWLIISEQISTCGDSILTGYSFIRRFGLILSKTSARRRFVQSLNHAFSSSTEYYIKAGFTINRQFIFNTFFWLGVFSALLTSLHPFRLEKELITVCSAKGNCVIISRSRIRWNTQGKPGVVELENLLDKEKLTTLIHSITSRPTTTPENKATTIAEQTNTIIPEMTRTFPTGRTSPSTTIIPEMTRTSPTTTIIPEMTRTSPTTTIIPEMTRTSPTTTIIPEMTRTSPTGRTSPTTTLIPGITRTFSTGRTSQTTTIIPGITRTFSTGRTSQTTTIIPGITRTFSTRRTSPTTTIIRRTTNSRQPAVIECPGAPGESVTRQPNICNTGGMQILPYINRGVTKMNCPRSSTDDQQPFSGEVRQLRMCSFETSVNLNRRDDCSSVNLGNILNGDPALIRPVAVTHTHRGKSITYLLCCYDYGFPPPPTSLQLNRCNMPFVALLASSRCKIPREDGTHPRNIETFAPEIQDCTKIARCSFSSDPRKDCICGSATPITDSTSGLLTCPS